jgi:hypothetical protein
MIFFQNQQSSAPIGQNSSIINIPIYFLFNEQGFIIDLEQLQTCFSTDSFENSVVNQFINLINRNLPEKNNPFIISLLENTSDEIYMLKSLLYLPLKNLLINLFENMPIDMIINLLINLPIRDLNDLFCENRVNATINFQKKPLKNSQMTLFLKLSENLLKNLFVNLPENIKKNLITKYSWFKIPNSPEFPKIVTRPKPLLNLPSELVGQNQNKQSRKSFSEKQKKIIILFDSACRNVRTCLMKKLFENDFGGEEVYYEYKKLQNPRLESIEYLSNTKYNVEIINPSLSQESYEGYVAIHELPFLWEYINNTENIFDIALIIFDLNEPIERIYTQIFKWLFFLKTFKSQNIKAIITFIKSKISIQGLAFFNNIEKIKLAKTLEENKILADNKIKEIISKLKIEASVIKSSNGFFYSDSYNDMAEFRFEMDSLIG